MSNHLTEARTILATNKSDQAARESMTFDQRNAISEDYAGRKQFLSAAHFAPDKEKSAEFARLFWEQYQR